MPPPILRMTLELIPTPPGRLPMPLPMLRMTLQKDSQALGKLPMPPFKVPMTLFAISAASSGLDRGMEYNSAQIVQETGVTLRTIRLWVARKLVPPPLGKGPGTRYTEEHLFLIKAVKDLVTLTHDLETVRYMINERTREQLAEFVGLGPRREAPEATTPPVAPSDATIETRGSVETPLPEGARWVIVGLLPNLALMVGEDAAPLVRRVAAEICREYGRG